MEYKTRINYLRNEISKADVDSVLITDKENIRYYSGFTGTLAYLIINLDKSIIVTDSRYTIRAKEECPDYEVYQLRSGDNWIENITNSMDSKIIGFEGSNITFNMLEQLKVRINKQVEWKDFSTPITLGRIIKSDSEVKLIEAAINISDTAFNKVEKQIKAGITEKEISWEIEKTMRELGAESPSFDTIVASGTNGSKPHHSPTDKIVKEGEGIVIDMGAKYQGYCSDLTRTIFLGEPDSKFKEIYSIVLRSQMIAIETVKPNMTGEDIDLIAREIITNEGHGDNFGHSLGHGVGIEVHEGPGVGPNSKNIVKSGMIYTVEPGIYIEGWGGVRIEDMVMMTDTGNNLLSNANKEVY
jgi:Xaa-Pro aminopeptidase